MLERALIGVFVFFLVVILVMVSLPAIASTSAAVRTDAAQDTGVNCTTGSGETSCTITLAAEHAWPDTTAMTVTETSPGSADRTSQSTVQSDRTMVLISGLTASTSYTFTVDYAVQASDVSDALNSLLVPLPLLIVLVALVAVVAGVIVGFWIFATKMRS